MASTKLFNPADIIDLREQAKSFERIASWDTLPVNLLGGSSPERFESLYVTTNFFQTLGVEPLLGHNFTPEGEARNSTSVIISYGLWQRQFGGTPDVIGRKINLGLPADQTPTGIIIGVMPAELNFPARTDLWTSFDYARAPKRGGTHYSRTIARLKPSATIEQAQAEVDTITQNQAQLYPDTNAGWEMTVVPFREHLFGSARVALPLLFGAVGFVLLIACTNIANLQLARAAARQKEIAVRLALEPEEGESSDNCLSKV
ncbi:MAG: ABC transporter permease [Pyrinomonadaceae bacterium]